MTLTINTMTDTLKDHPAFDGHETVIMAEDTDIGFKAFIAVHNTSRGQALGGCRYWSRYRSDDEAITDVLRLSRGMTYKNAVADLPLGGGKSVIIGTPGTRHPTAEMMQAVAKAVNAIYGQYVTAEDVGMSVDHMLIARGVTRHVAGLPIEIAGGHAMPDGLNPADYPHADPSPYTAYGTFQSVRAAVKHKMGRDDLTGLTVSVKGYGNVARTLCKYLAEAGAVVTVSEIDDGRIAQAKEDGFAVLDKGVDIMSHKADIYAPCALGGDITPDSIDTLVSAGVKIVAGCANNQLAVIDRDSKLLTGKGILYAPDYVANAGGVIAVGMQHVWSDVPNAATFPTHDKTMMRVGNIYKTLLEIFARAESEGKTTAQVADEIARERFSVGKAGKVEVMAAAA